MGRPLTSPGAEDLVPSAGSSDREPLLVIVLGPTASGKTALALALARRFHGEIINCDSVAMYREFEIGTAKPSAAERSEVRHHLVDCTDPLSDVTAGDFARDARAVLHRMTDPEILARNSHEVRLPIVSGGTGLYLRALVQGLFPGPPRSEELRAKLRTRGSKRGPEYLHKILRRMDPVAAAQIHANDAPKLIRAIEVCLSARRPMTELWQSGRDPLQGFRILRFGLNPERGPLYERINQRATQMFDQGLVAETKYLLQKYGEHARPLSSLGYRQAVQLLRGELNREQAIAAAQQAHRNYAKRQMTWFRREPHVHWLKGFGDDSTIQSEAIATVEQQM
jgi:tRNA dimethylallyltransferase